MLTKRVAGGGSYQSGGSAKSPEQSSSYIEGVTQKRKGDYLTGHKKEDRDQAGENQKDKQNQERRGKEVRKRKKKGDHPSNLDTSNSLSICQHGRQNPGYDVKTSPKEKAATQKAEGRMKNIHSVE